MHIVHIYIRVCAFIVDERAQAPYLGLCCTVEIGL